ncbi:MAG: hypothetical protein KatS3mg060_2248 [Dehalococcoidia bacterium]|nr:MAG: hypothetical protein KatS3mg060_2248 [Dehalococcoidia bacterium]
MATSSLPALVTLYIALTSFRTRARGVAAIVAVAGMTSIGWMAAVNFLIDSDFKWLLFGFGLLWASAVALYWTGT